MTMHGSCHCGAIQIEVPGPPQWVAHCNCSICKKTGGLIAYYPDDGSVKVTGAMATYIWGDRMIAFHHCPTCACRSHWTSTGESYGRIGVNARLFDGFAVRADGPTFDGVPLEVRFSTMPTDNTRILTWSRPGNQAIISYG